MTEEKIMYSGIAFRGNQEPLTLTLAVNRGSLTRAKCKFKTRVLFDERAAVRNAFLAAQQQPCNLPRALLGQKIKRRCGTSHHFGILNRVA